MQSVGGIAVSQPFKESAGWVLPVRADVSGLQTVTVKPTLLNSAVVCTSVQTSIEGNVIYVTVKTGVARKGLSSTCPFAQLGTIKSGSYAVLYREPSGKTVKLRDVAVGP